MLYYTILYYTIPYYTLLYYTVIFYFTAAINMTYRIYDTASIIIFFRKGTYIGCKTVHLSNKIIQDVL